MQERRRRHQKHGPVHARHASARRRQEQPIGHTKRGSSDVTAKDRQLVAEHENLEILHIRRSDPQENKLQDALKRHIHDG